MNNFQYLLIPALISLVSVSAWRGTLYLSELQFLVVHDTLLLLLVLSSLFGPIAMKYNIDTTSPAQVTTILRPDFLFSHHLLLL